MREFVKSHSIKGKMREKLLDGQTIKCCSGSFLCAMPQQGGGGGGGCEHMRGNGKMWFTKLMLYIKSMNGLQCPSQTWNHSCLLKNNECRSMVMQMPDVSYRGIFTHLCQWLCIIYSSRDPSNPGNLEKCCEWLPFFQSGKSQNSRSTGWLAVVAFSAKLGYPRI